jgi:hypothetical protein
MEGSISRDYLKRIGCFLRSRKMVLRCFLSFAIREDPRSFLVIPYWAKSNVPPTEAGEE